MITKIRRYIDWSFLTLKCSFAFFFQFFLPKTEKIKTFTFIGRHLSYFIPIWNRNMHSFESMTKYLEIKVQVYRDATNNLPYVIHNKKKLFFPQRYRDVEIQLLYRNLLIEQDEESPHQYVDSYNILDKCSLLDCGASEGIFTLDAIEFVNRAYLFECDEKWVKALEATFADYKEKITIVQKYVNCFDDADNITIDTFLKEKNTSDLFIKMDIEGAELAALEGAKQTLLDSTSKINCAICTYHNRNDAKNIHSRLQSCGFKCQFTSGFLLLGGSLRRGVIRGRK
jgi:hypothetical protein